MWFSKKLCVYIFLVQKMFGEARRSRPNHNNITHVTSQHFTYAITKRIYSLHNNKYVFITLHYVLAHVTYKNNTNVTQKHHVTATYLPNNIHVILQNNAYAI